MTLIGTAYHDYSKNKSHHVCFIWQTLNGNIIIILCKIIPFRARVNSSSISTQNVLSGKWQHPLKCLPSSVKYSSLVKPQTRDYMVDLTNKETRSEPSSFFFALLKNVSTFYFWATKSEAINFIMRGTHITIFFKHHKTTARPLPYISQGRSLISSSTNASDHFRFHSSLFKEKKKAHRRCQTAAQMYTKLD